MHILHPIISDRIMSCHDPLRRAMTYHLTSYLLSDLTRISNFISPGLSCHGRSYRVLPHQTISCHVMPVYFLVVIACSCMLKQWRVIDVTGRSAHGRFMITRSGFRMAPASGGV